jgi:putative peptidoglycan lipid II flippase
VNVLFQRGRFDYAATTGTAEALLFYSLGIWAVVGVRVVTAGFYSLQDTKTPVKIAVVAMIANIVFSLLLMKPLKHSGLAFANSLASGINFIILFFFFRKKLRRIGGAMILSSFIKSALASAVMGVAGMLILRGELWKTGGHILTKSLYMTGTIILCAGVYGLLSYLLKSEELSFIVKMIRMKLKKRSLEVL